MAHKKPTWIVEWFLIGMALIGFLMMLVADAHGATKRADELGIDLIDRVKIMWNTTKCEEWPEKDGTYKCTGTFYVHANGIKANHK